MKRKERTETPSGGPKSFAHCFFHRPVGVTALVFLITVLVLCIIAPLIAPYGPNVEDLTSVLSLPSWHHLLGTDELGRDVLSRLLYGGVSSFESVGIVIGVAMVLSVPLGLIAAFRGKTTDIFLSRLAELGLAIPGIVVLLMVFSLPGATTDEAMVVLGLLSVPGLFRVVRGAALPLRDSLYVANAKLSGVSTWKILWRHILPGTAGPLVVNASLTSAVVLTVLTGLNFLGLGITVPNPSWGGMIGEALTDLQQQPWLLVPSGVTVGLVILAFVLVGDAVRDSLAEKWAFEAPSSSKGQIAAAEMAVLDDEVAVPNATSMLSLRGLSVSVEQGEATIPVTTGVSFDLMPGQSVAIVGESGCGKTLTATAILGLLSGGARVVNGECWFDGDNLLDAKRSHKKGGGARIGYVAQDPLASLDPCFTVRSQIGEIVRSHGRISRSAANKRVNELLLKVQISDPVAIGRRYPHQLSGGMAQRVQIAMALATNPKLLVADEPTTALDVTTQSEILDLLRDLGRQEGMAILLITHDWGVVADICDRAIVMYAGQVVEQGEVRQLVQEPLHPYTRALLMSNPSRGVHGQRLVTIRGSVPRIGEWNTGCRFYSRCDLATAECADAIVPLEDIASGRETRCLHYEELRTVTEVAG